MQKCKHLVATLAATALAVAVAGGAAAQNGGGSPHGTPPGQGGTPPGQVGKAAPPGQAKKAKRTPSRTATQAKRARPAAKAGKPKPRPKPSPSATAAARNHGNSAPGKTTICHRTGSAKNPWVLITVSNSSLDAHRRHGDIVPASSCPSGAAGPQQGNNAHDKVTICHRTSSEKNPYVVITIALAGWENGHSKHEGDRILQPGDDPEQLCRPASAGAVAGGSQQSRACPTGEGNRTVLGVWHKTGSRKNPYVFTRPNRNSAHYDASKHPDDIVVYGPAQSQTATGSCAAAAPGETPAASRGTARGGVAGVKASKSGPGRAGAEKPRTGVLGVSHAKRALAGRLPFTGIPLWAVLLGGLALIATGLAIRRTRVGAVG
jgi:hypothetical protein